VYLLNGEVAALRDGDTVSLVTGDWTRPEVNWGIPAEIAAGLKNTAPVRSPLIGFAEAMGVPHEHRSTDVLCVKLCAAAAAEPERAAAYGVDIASAALLPELCAHPSDLVDVLTGGFDPWEATTPAALRWPQYLCEVPS
jgi:hypothetical protein